MNSYQMMLHRPVETAGVVGNFDFESTPSARMMRLHRRHNFVTGGGITLHWEAAYQ
jgi:hypothetical protein